MKVKIINGTIGIYSDLGSGYGVPLREFDETICERAYRFAYSERMGQIREAIGAEPAWTWVVPMPDECKFEEPNSLESAAEVLQTWAQRGQSDATARIRGLLGIP